PSCSDNLRARYATWSFREPRSSIVCPIHKRRVQRLCCPAKDPILVGGGQADQGLSRHCQELRQRAFARRIVRSPRKPRGAEFSDKTRKKCFGRRFDTAGFGENAGRKFEVDIRIAGEGEQTGGRGIGWSIG